MVASEEAAKCGPQIQRALNFRRTVGVTPSKQLCICVCVFVCVCVWVIVANCCEFAATRSQRHVYGVENTMSAIPTKCFSSLRASNVHSQAVVRTSVPLLPTRHSSLLRFLAILECAFVRVLLAVAVLASAEQLTNTMQQ